MAILDLPPIVRGYLECALWASTDEDDFPLDENFDTEDFAEEAITQAIAECAAFVDANTADCDAYREQREAMGYGRSQGTIDDYLGHDLWLTRNGHGAGFWDRGLGTVGECLSRAARVYGSVDLYVGDDGLIYA